MRPAAVAISLLEAGIILLSGSLTACAKTQPEAHAAPAASETAAATPAAAGAGAPDTQPPPGVDISKLRSQTGFIIITKE